MDKHPEDVVWQTADPEDLWVLDKLILSRHLKYTCGPTGLDVPASDWYIVRPCVNMLGLGLGTRIEYLEGDTQHLPLGFFWCEIFKGRHLSIDYHWGAQVLAVEGFKDNNTFTQWREWKTTGDVVPLPNILVNIAAKYEWVNCEFINGNIIEVHLRPNVDFQNNITHFIPVWQGQDTIPPAGYTYISYPDVHGRIGAFVK